MVRRLFRAKPLSEPVLAFCVLDRMEHIQWKLNQNTTIAIKEYVVDKCRLQNGQYLSRP